MEVARETLEYDVVVVGGGPAGLATAIRIMQTRPTSRVVVLEKGSAPGAHTLSGAVIDPRALDELVPHWRAAGAPLRQEVTDDQLLMLSRSGGYSVPRALLPSCFKNHGNYIASLGELVGWLSEQAEGLGVELFYGFPATEVLYSPNGAVRGVATKEVGIDRNGKRTSSYQAGVELIAPYTVFAEGSRGQLGREIIAKYDLESGRNPQSYAIGLKEVWEVPAEVHQAGLVVHTAGWPLDSSTYGGSFIYHASDRKINIGFVVGLDYKDPHLSPFEEFQRFKTHPRIRGLFEGGKRLSYGARAITAGGISSLPELVFPGGALVGCEAGFLNASRIKGSHAAIKSGILCAEAISAALDGGRSGDVLADYADGFRSSWLYEELEKAKNFKQWFKYGRTVGMVMTGVEQWLLPKVGLTSAPWTLKGSTADHARLGPAEEFAQRTYPKPDGVLTFDRASSVFLSNTNHSENQPPHLTLRNANVPVLLNLPVYAGPEARYCPAGVYEFVEGVDGSNRLQINAQNCVHCKTCDIKDPTQNIVWVAPEGGGGPNYQSM